MPSFMIWQTVEGKRLQLTTPRLSDVPFMTQSQHSEPNYICDMQGRLNEWNALCHARREVRFRAFAYCFMGDGPKKVTVPFVLCLGNLGGASNTYLGPGRGPRGHDVWPLGGKKGSAFDVFVRLRTALVPGLVKTALFWCFHLNFTRLARFRCRRAISHRDLEIAQFGLN